MERVVITGMGIWSCLGTSLDQVRQSLYEGRSGIVLDLSRKEVGFRSGLTGKVPLPDLKGELPRMRRAYMPEQALYAFINIYVCSRVIDAVMMGFSGNKACFIMTSRWEEITKRLMDEVGRGVTHLSAKGAYTGTQQPVVLCVAARQEIMSVKRIVEEEDEKAFMFISEAHEALGEGFSRLDSRD